MPLTLEELKTIACAAVDGAAKQLQDVATEIWNHPEENFQEVHAHKILTDCLSENGFEVSRSYVVNTAFRATHTSGAGPNIAVLCEYDALPEIGHACGHNLIAEVGVGAGIGIKAALKAAAENGQELGTVTVLGTPAEEGGGGKVDLIQAGAFKDLDAAMMCHPFNANCLDPDVCLLAIQRLEITYHGKASHASAFPWEGLNALDAAVMAYTNISVMRQQMKPNWKIHGVITNGGLKPNIIPEETSLCYYLRATDRKELAALKEKCSKCFEAAAIATGCTVEFKWNEKPYDNMVSNPTLMKLFGSNGKKLDVTFLTDKEIEAMKTSASTDMGNVSYEVPSIHPMFYIGSHKSGDVVYNHTRDFTDLTGSATAQPYTLNQAKLMAMTGLDCMFDKELMKQAKEEFNTITK